MRQIRPRQSYEMWPQTSQVRAWQGELPEWLFWEARPGSIMIHLRCSRCYQWDGGAVPAAVSTRPQLLALCEKLVHSGQEALLVAVPKAWWWILEKTTSQLRFISVYVSLMLIWWYMGICMNDTEWLWLCIHSLAMFSPCWLMVLLWARRCPRGQSPELGCSWLKRKRDGLFMAKRCRRCQKIK